MRRTASEREIEQEGERGMKIITICGSLKFEKEMKEAAEKMELAGNCVIAPVYPVKPKDAYTDSETDILNRMHKEKIRISDAILVVDVNHYIGESTKGEIAFAQSLGKEVLYDSDIFCENCTKLSPQNQ